MPRASTRLGVPEPQSQPSYVGTGRHKERSGRAVEIEDEGGEDDAESKDENTTVDRKANDLVRLALFTEYRRTPLKRDEIAKKVFGTRMTKGDFEAVLERAQEILQKTFGMELHEIMSRAERDRADATRDGAHDGENNVAGIKRKTLHASSKQYILRSILSKTIIEAASVYDVEIEDAERAERVLWPADDDTCRPQGTLFSWMHASTNQLCLAGILHVLLALILVNGRVLGDMQLRTYLKRLRLPMGSAIPSNAMSQTNKTNTIDAYLAQLVKQSYLDKTSLVSAQGGQKRVRSGAGVGGTEDGETNFEWRWGTRAIAEIGEEGIGDFLVDFMHGIESERESRRGGASARGSSRNETEKRKEKILIAIGRTAGGYGGLMPYV